MAQQIGSLVVASDDPQQLPAVLKSPRLSSAYAAYLEVLQKRRLNVLTTWPSGSAFVGGAIAGRLRQAVLETVWDATEWEEFAARGTFSSFNMSDRKFRFVDSSSDEEYSGTIAEEVALTQIKVGATTYDVTLGAISNLHGLVNDFYMTGVTELDVDAPPAELVLTEK